MLDRSGRETRPFGRRRPTGDEPVPGQAEAAADGPRPAGPLLWALRTVAIAGFAAVMATQYLVRMAGPGEVVAPRLAQMRASQPDPETTGSIARGAAQATRLDPCALAPGRPHP